MTKVQNPEQPIWQPSGAQIRARVQVAADSAPSERNRPYERPKVPRPRQ